MSRFSDILLQLFLSLRTEATQICLYPGACRILELSEKAIRGLRIFWNSLSATAWLVLSRGGKSRDPSLAVRMSFSAQHEGTTRRQGLGSRNEAAEQSPATVLAVSPGKTKVQNGPV